VTERLGLADADALVGEQLGDTPRAAHSRVVGAVLRQLAIEFGGDADLWQIVGLVHDLDYFAVAGDWSQHGRLTAESLVGQLPAEALEAIAAHDHRSGVSSASEMADMLRLADAVAVLDEGAGRKATLVALGDGRLAHICVDRPYLAAMIESLADRHGLALRRLAVLLQGLPEQG
jgi:hypothetical protein